MGAFGTTQDITGMKQAEESLRRSIRRFEILAKTSGELLESTRPQSLVESLCREVMEHLDCQAFFNFIGDDRVGRLHLNAYAGIPPEEAKRIEWLDYGIAVCGCAARDGCRIVAEHIPTTPDVRTELVKTYGIKAYACHPLLGTGGKVMGTLSFGTKKPGNVFFRRSVAYESRGRPGCGCDDPYAGRAIIAGKRGAASACAARGPSRGVGKGCPLGQVYLVS